MQKSRGATSARVTSHLLCVEVSRWRRRLHHLSLQGIAKFWNSNGLPPLDQLLQQLVVNICSGAILSGTQMAKELDSTRLCAEASTQRAAYPFSRDACMRFGVHTCPLLCPALRAPTATLAQSKQGELRSGWLRCEAGQTCSTKCWNGDSLATPKSTTLATGRTAAREAVPNARCRTRSALSAKSCCSRRRRPRARASSNSAAMRAAQNCCRGCGKVLLPSRCAAPPKKKNTPSRSEGLDTTWGATLLGALMPAGRAQASWPCSSRSCLPNFMSDIGRGRAAAGASAHTQTNAVRRGLLPT